MIKDFFFSLELFYPITLVKNLSTNIDEINFQIMLWTWFFNQICYFCFQNLLWFFLMLY